MKLRNKKTGEIREVKKIMVDDMFTINSLAELNEWEDYEEPKDFWYIDNECGVMCESTDPSLWDKKYAIEFMKQIGNYFETKEEAEKAVEKLKAWKRLKDSGFVFCGKGDCLDTIKFDYGPAGYNNQDFNLLFGGEE
jgi:hypothetical protein